MVAVTRTKSDNETKHECSDDLTGGRQHFHHITVSKPLYLREKLEVSMPGM